jgi:integrase
MRGHVRKRGRKWSIVYDEGRDENGRRIQRWRGGFATKKEAEDELAKVLESINTGSYVEPSKLKAGDYLLEWVASLGDVRPSTRASYEQNLTKHVKPGIGHLPLQRLTALHLDGLYRSLLQPEEKPGEKLAKPLSPRTVQYVHVIVHRALKDAVRKNLLLRNVADAASPPKPQRQEIRRWAAAELGRFLNAVEDDRLYAAWRMLAMTGMRRGEALGLRWSDVDLAAGTISIRQTLIAPGYKLALSTPKTAKGRRKVAIDTATVEAMRAHRKAQLEERLAFGPDYPVTLETFGDLVFRKADGQPVNPVAFGKRFERTVANLDVPRIPLHGLRHTWATLALSQNVHPKIVSERLGHSTIAITLDTYSDVLPGLQEEAAATVAALVGG